MNDIDRMISFVLSINSFCTKAIRFYKELSHGEIIAFVYIFSVVIFLVISFLVLLFGLAVLIIGKH